MAAKEVLWESGYDESVEVNQRALIDKVLARYSGEFTVFRELLQNSDDAQSKTVEIRFETQKYIDLRKAAAGELQEDNTKETPLPDLKTVVVHQWTLKNNGIIFRDEDWSRLKKIAEGNPDEEKIGAFGVGFYSLFSVTEEPFVTSGGQWMGFHWKDKKDQLFARRGTLPSSSESDTKWTSFEMILREPGPIPAAFDFTRFLASSITFMTHLEEVSVYLDDNRLARLTKSCGAPRNIVIPKGLKRSSDMGIMNVKQIKSTPLNIKAEVMLWVYTSGTKKPPPVSQMKPASQGGFFSSLFSSIAGSTTPQRPAHVSLEPTFEAPNRDREVTETSVALSIFSADVDVRLDKKLSTELYRSTKKNPPKTLKYDLIYTAKGEYDASVKEDENQLFATGSVFQGLRADLEGSGSARVFIGHATGQTTGIGGHMASRFIPTVERESIDLVDRNVAVWNRQLLYVGGFIARTAYEVELADIQTLWKGAISSASNPEPTQEIRSWLLGRALHTLKFFTFHQSTPSSDVAIHLEDAFFSCGGGMPFSIISTAGIRVASEVRIPDKTFASFLNQLPVLPDEIISGANTMVVALRHRGLLKDITFADVLNELRSNPLAHDQMVACMKWWVNVVGQGSNPNILQIRTEFLNAAVLVTGVPGTSDEKIIPLSSVRTFIVTKASGAFIPVDSPLPAQTMPPAITKNFSPSLLSSSFGWKELSVVDWLRYLADNVAGSSDVDHDICLSPTYAEHILSILSRAWPSLSKDAQASVVSILEVKPCIPTSAGLKIAKAAYLPNVNIFPDLAVVTLPSGLPVKAPLEKVLLAVGVRKRVDLEVIFSRMIKTGDWTVFKLIKYLVSIQSSLSPEEWERLRATSAFVQENSDNSPTGSKRRKASQLYEPLDVFRQLQLPTLDWGAQNKWNSRSPEAEFLYRLGLTRYPSIKGILGLAADADATKRNLALKYFLDHLHAQYSTYDPLDYADIPFVPALKDGVAQMGTTKEVFAGQQWATLGCLVVHPSIRDNITKLKLRENPPTSLLVNLLERTPPKDEEQAKEWFGAMATLVSEFSGSELKRLAQIPMIPTTGKTGDKSLRLLPPSQCYFDGESRAQFHSKLFVFVNFGTKANGFLSACGVKREPSVEEITNMLLEDPRKFYELTDGRDNFLIELRNIAVHQRLLSSTTLTRIRRSPVLLGMKRMVREAKVSKFQDKFSFDELDEEDWEFEYDLKKPDEIIIADDSNAYQIFGASVYTAPQEDLLEGFYASLGSRRLSSLVKEDYETTSEVKNSTVAPEIRSRILERLPLFLHEHTHARTRVSYTWLNDANHFIVKTFGKLTVRKTLAFGNLRLSRNEDASAAARRNGAGPIELLLAGNGQVDMYEVATSLCKLLFDSQKVNDALLFSTILSTDLRALRRRGYNIDRILKQQKAHKQAAEDAAKAKSESTALVPQRPPDVPPKPVPIAPATPAVNAHSPPPPNTSSTDISSEKEPLLPGPIESPGIRNGGRPSSKLLSPLQNLRHRWSGIPHIPGQVGSSSIGIPGDIPRPGSAPPVPRPSSRSPMQDGITPLSNINHNIDMAIQACAQEKSDLLRTQQQMQVVKEASSEGYCDLSGAVDLKLIGEIGSDSTKVKVFVSRDVPDSASIMFTKRDALARFVHVITPLARIYSLPITHLHIFYDLHGPIIAFNRSASLFLNLRVYESWHDNAVKGGDVREAYTSWYFTLAHEIAHNLVQPHNSEHEFYMSAICEKHIMSLSALLSQS